MSSNLYDGVDVQVLRADVNTLQSSVGGSQYAAALAAATHVYLAGNGNDANTGASFAQAKATIAGVWALLPFIQKGAFVVHMDNGGYTWTAPPPNIQLNNSCFILFVGDGPNATLTGAITIASGSTPTVIKTTGLTTDQYAGWSFAMQSGNTTGCRRCIAGNTATDIRLTAALVNSAGVATAPAAGDSITAWRPRAWINFTAPSTPDALVTIDSRVHFVQCAFGPAAANTQVTVQSDGVLYGVEVLAYATLLARRVFAGTCDSDFFAAMLTAQTGAAPAITKAQWEGWGISRTTAAVAPSAGGTIVDVASQGSFLGYVAGRAAAVINGPSAEFRMLGGLLDSLLAAGRNCEVALGLVTIYGTQGHAIATSGDCEIACNDDVVLYTAASTGNYGLSIEGKARFRAENALTIYGFSTGAALRVAGCGAIAVNGVLSIAQYANANPILVSQAGSLTVGGGVFLTNTSPAHNVYVIGCGQAHLNATLTVNSTHASSCGFFVGENGRLSMAAAALSAVNGASAQDCGQVVCTGAFSLTSVSGIALGVVGPGASFACGGAVTIGNNGLASVYVDRGGRCSFSSTSAAKVLTNTGSGAGICGVRCLAGGQFDCSSNLTTTISAAQCYGCDVRGGGRAFFAAQPTGVVGTLADFIVGQGANDAYPDTALSVVYNSIAAGGSLVQRSA